MQGNYTVTYESGVLTIEKRNVTLTSATDEKEYDGKALTNGNVTVGGEGFADDEGATYTVTGSQTEPFPKKRTRKFAKKQNESLSFWEMLVQAARCVRRLASNCAGECHPNAECGRTEL